MAPAGVFGGLLSQMAVPERLVRSEKYTYRVLSTLGSGLQGKVKRGVNLATEEV